MTTPAATSTAPGAGLDEHWELPPALREALADDVTNLVVSMTEAVLASGLGFKGPFEEFGPAVEEIVLDALASARRDGAQIANEAAANAIAASREAEVAAIRERDEAQRQLFDIRQRKGKVGPELWGRHPKNRHWTQIDDGQHPEVLVAQFEADYTSAGWTDLRRTNPHHDSKARLAATNARAERLAETLREIAAATPEPDDKAWRDEWNEPAAYRVRGSNGTVIQCSPPDHGEDREAFGFERGLHAAAVIARAALAESGTREGGNGA